METGKLIENRKNIDVGTKIHPATSLNSSNDTAGILCVPRLHICLYPDEEYKIKIFSLHLGLYIMHCIYVKCKI